MLSAKLSNGQVGLSHKRVRMTKPLCSIC